MQGKQYHSLRVQFLSAINSAIITQNDKKSGLEADETAVTRLTDYLSLNAETPVSQIHSTISLIISTTTHKVTTGGFMSSKEEIKPTPFAIALQAILNRFNLPTFLIELEKDYAQLLAQNASAAIDRTTLDEIHALKAALEAKKTEVRNLVLKSESLEEKNEILEETINVQKGKIKSLELEVSDLDKSNKDCYQQLESISKRLKDANEKSFELDSEYKKLNVEYTELRVKSGVASAQLEALHSLKDSASQEAQRRQEELEKVKREYEIRIKELVTQLNEKEALLQQNHKFINEELQETFTRVNESLNQSQIMRQNQSMSVAASSKPSLAKNVGQQREKMSADPKARQDFIDNERRYILEAKRLYLTNERLQAIFIIAQQLQKLDRTKPERAFCVECIKLLAPTKPTTYGTTADCVEAIKKMAVDHKLNENDSVMHFIRSLSSIKADAPQKKLDDASHIKLLDSLHRIFSTRGYHFPELGQYYPTSEKAATEASTPLNTVENNVK